jgi:hypothetical protein
MLFVSNSESSIGSKPLKGELESHQACLTAAQAREMREIAQPGLQRVAIERDPFRGRTQMNNAVRLVARTVAWIAMVGALAQSGTADSIDNCTGARPIPCYTVRLIVPGSIGKRPWLWYEFWRVEANFRTSTSEPSTVRSRRKHESDRNCWRQRAIVRGRNASRMGRK